MIINREVVGAVLQDWQHQRKHLVLLGTSSNVTNARMPMFSLVDLTLQELLTNKGFLDECWFLLLNNKHLWDKRPRISPTHLVKYSYCLINYFEYIGIFYFDFWQWGMYAYGLLLNVYCHSQGGKDSYGILWSHMDVHLYSLGAGTVVSLARNLKECLFTVQISLLS